MRRIFALAIMLTGFCITSVTLPAADEAGPFAIWMLNNESQTLRILAHDRAVLDVLQSPLPILPELPTGQMPRPELDLMLRHQKMMKFLVDSVGLSAQAQTLRDGRGFEKVNAALSAARDQMGKPLFRQVIQYLEDFAALYPSERQSRAFISVLPLGFSPDSPALGMVVRGPAGTASGSAIVTAGRGSGSGSGQPAEQIFKIFGEAGSDAGVVASATGAEPPADASDTAEVASGTASGTASGSDDPFNVFGK
jgi:hypothetical protein